LPAAPHPLVLRGREALQRGDMRAVEAAADERLKTAGAGHKRARASFHRATEAWPVWSGCADAGYCHWKSITGPTGLTTSLVQLFMGHGKPETLKRWPARRFAPTRGTPRPQPLRTILSEMNNLPAGEWHFRSALELSGPQAQVLMNSDSNLMKQGRTDEANGYFAQAHSLAPQDMKTLAYWSTLSEGCGDLKRAGELLDLAEAASSAAEINLLRGHLPVASGQTHRSTRDSGRSRHTRRRSTFGAWTSARQTRQPRRGVGRFRRRQGQAAEGVARN